VWAKKNINKRRDGAAFFFFFLSCCILVVFLDLFLCALLLAWLLKESAARA